MDAKLSKLIENLAKSPPATDIGDEDIETEIKAVRRMDG